MQPDLHLVGAEVHELHSVRAELMSTMRDATYSAETQRELKLLYKALDRLDVMPTQRAALLDVIQRWDDNEATQIPACEICGSTVNVQQRGWHDEGSPMATCEQCGGPDESGAA